jgi:hypothetical protein
MKKNNFKKICIIIFIGFFPNLHADYYTETNPYFPQTSAMLFIKKAGSVAGAARACGQDISVFINRVNEALYRLSLSSGDKVLASAHFQNVLNEAQTAQINNPVVSCAQVLQDYNNLPLMRDDYRTTVLSTLNPSMGQNPSFPAPGAPYQSPITDSIGDRRPPNINTLAPAGLPPPPPTPIDTNAQNINVADPSVGPRVDPTVPHPNIIYLAPNPRTNEPPPISVSNPFAGRPP